MIKNIKDMPNLIDFTYIHFLRRCWNSNVYWQTLCTNKQFSILPQEFELSF